MFPALIEEREIAQILRRASATELMPRFERTTARRKADGSLVTEADTALQTAIETALKREWPDISLLGEEMELSEQKRLLRSGDPIWCLDPLDGTTNFAHGTPFFAISLALLVEGKTSLSAVYDPCRDELFQAKRGEGAFLNGKPIIAEQRESANLGDSIAIIDYKRLPPTLASRLVSERPWASQRSFGAVALEWCYLALRRGEIYLHGQMNLWDYAAGLLFLEELGGRAVTLEGEPLFTPEIRSRSAVGASDNELFMLWQEYILNHQSQDRKE